MGYNKLKRLFNTVKYLRPIQIYYRAYYFIKNRVFGGKSLKRISFNASALNWTGYEIWYKNSYSTSKTFCFLNVEHTFPNNIDWNLNAYGKLWTYNLNYFEFLNQENIQTIEGIGLIKDYIGKDQILLDGKEPYPISLRGINWIKFLSKNKINDNEINKVLFNHYQILYHNLEYHLLGNHLLENGYALLFGAYYFKDEKLYKKANKILYQQLKEQILKDGAHFELSPMYHQILLHRLLDSINLVKYNIWKHDDLLPFLSKTAIRMLSWLQSVTYKNGNIPMVNDSAYGIAPSSSDLFNYAKKLELKWDWVNLSESGYRKVENEKYELFLDVGEVGPKYQPGHAHSDTFSFELYVKEFPVIVDTGISTYEKNETRQQERATVSHNTVKVGEYEQTEVWGGFRVANRAQITSLEEFDNVIKATHNGYKRLNLMHTRQFCYLEKMIEIKDTLSNNTGIGAKAYLHLHPDIKEIKYSENLNQIELKGKDVTITFSKEVNEVNLLEYNYPLGYNKTVKAKKIEVSFDSYLKTRIEIK